ncbi:hypothetical protein DUNSADRAFT_9380 [Dunaliella salina]|uniref:Encoded protein n=1 Tax=Dunaliella salina TaxID=3046 RepID=A0ABQ7GHN0_DUNSA|nr:hypothetical protein DUNSADRAFT_9380 [Dunaliella salina]|eukprot:KAF5834103.1 hypothetical protein DUNSADRAFT_9380 [Dunaliella salina]
MIGLKVQQQQQAKALRGSAQPSRLRLAPAKPPRYTKIPYLQGYCCGNGRFCLKEPPLAQSRMSAVPGVSSQLACGHVPLQRPDA